MPQVKPDIETFVRIKVVGVGGSGSNAIHRMMRARIKGVDYIAINTDVQALHHHRAPVKVHIGRTTTRGLGAGMNPVLGREAADENREDIKEVLDGADLIFLTSGLGGGTGTGALPIIADIAREIGALVVTVVTKPFTFEGTERRRIAEEGWQELQGRVDALITIPNDKLLGLIQEATTLERTFLICDDVLRAAVQGISDIITAPGIVNVDFADVRAVLKGAGVALLGVGSARGKDRASKAAHFAIHSPLFEHSLEGARSVLFNISGDKNLAMSEVYTVAKIITDCADPDSRVIFGAVNDATLGRGELKVTVIGAGFKPAGMTQVKLTPLFTPAPRTATQPSIAEVSLRKVVEVEKTEQEPDWQEVPAFLRRKKPRVL